jgi:DNA primase
MLNLYDKGVKNAVCVFGTQTLMNSARIRLMPYKVQGVTTVFIAFDGDDAGKLAMADLTPVIEQEGFIVDTIVLAEDTDPGDLNQEDIDTIKEYMNVKSSNS